MSSNTSSTDADQDTDAKSTTIVQAYTDGDPDPEHIPEQYRDDPDEPFGEHLGVKIGNGTNAFLADYVKAHPDYNSIPEVIRALARGLKDEKGSKTAEIVTELREKRSEL